MDDSFEREMWAEHVRLKRIEAVQGVWHALRQWCRHSDDCRNWQRPLYTAKAILCVLARRYGDTGYDCVSAVAIWGEQALVGEYSGTSWMQLDVGRGLFRGWRYWTGEDTSA